MSTMNWNTITLANIAPEPWRNGGGTTQTMLAWPSAEDWRIRCSVAQVASAGPFSSFVGVERWFAVLQGAGVVLTVDGKVHQQTTASQPLHFDGAARTDCDLIDGATQDFNLMLRSEEAQLGRMVRVIGEQTLTLHADEWCGVYTNHGATVLTAGEPNFKVAAGVLAWRQSTRACDIRLVGDDLLWMTARQ